MSVSQKLNTFTYSSRVPEPPQTVLDYHSCSGALARLTPPWEHVRVLTTSPLEAGAHIQLQVKIGPFSLGWDALIKEASPPHSFTDFALKSPFKYWLHKHCFENEAKGTRILDTIDYLLPGGPIVNFLARAIVCQKLQRMFSYRHAVMREDLARKVMNPSHIKPQTILITGASGMVGQALLPLLTLQGHKVLTLSHTPGKGNFYWNPSSKALLLPKVLEGVGVIIHLGGASIAKRWSASYKKQIYDSRIESTRTLISLIEKQKERPHTFICASSTAISPHLNNLEEPPTTDTPTSGNFLAEVTKDWELATTPLKAMGIRTVNLRMGIVLSPAGGLLSKLQLPFTLGLGGPVGSGKQTMSWITIDDVVDIISNAINNPNYEGPIHAVSPHPCPNQAFVQTLARVLKRPALVPKPAFLVKAILGELGENLALSSTRVYPKKLETLGYSFRFAHLEEALRHVLGR